MEARIAISYDKEADVMYMAFEDNELIAYRGIMPDFLRVNDKRIKAGWLSGNWVLPERRREGIATLLFNEAFKDWQGKLLYTNYAPASKAVYDKTGKFKIFKTLIGTRGFVRLNLHEVLPARVAAFKKGRFLLKIIDMVFNLFNDLRIKLINSLYHLKSVKIEYLPIPDEEILNFIKEHNTNELTQRGKDEYNWISKYPWVIPGSENAPMNKKYHFSALKNRSENLHLKVFNKNSGLMGYVFLSVKGNNLTIPYIYCHANDIESFRKIILKRLFKLKLNMVTVYNPLLADSFKKHFNHFIFKKKIVRNYIVSEELIKELPSSQQIHFQDGEGDVVFT